MNSEVCYASVAGPANRERGLKKQDAAMVRRTASGVLIVVCDGLGSRSKSDFGALQACRAVREAAAGMNPVSDGYTFCQSVHSKWLEMIAPVATEDAATTCLLAHVNSAGKAFLAQLGDGLILCRSNGKFVNVTPERHGFSDQTFALSEDYNFKEWVIHECELVIPDDGIVLMSDGISEDLDHERLEEFFEEIRMQTFKRKSSPMRRWLTQQLHEWPTPGHSDDKSIAAFFRGWGNDRSQ